MRAKLSRREALELGLGAAVLGVSSYAVSAAKTEPAQRQKEAKPMSAVAEFNKHGPFSYRDHQMFTQPDFPLPDFYKDMFKSWGMDSE